MLALVSVNWLAQLVVVLMGGRFEELPWMAGGAVTIAAVAVVLVRRPRHPLVGWFALIPVSSISASCEIAMSIAIDAGGPEGAAALVALLNLASQTAVVFASVGAARVVGLFPDGRATTGERRAVDALWLLLAVPPALLLLSPLVTVPFYFDAPPVPNPFALPFAPLDAQVGVPIGDYLGTVPPLVGGVVLIIRYVRAAPLRRQSMRWMFLPIATIVIALATQLLIGSGEPRWIIAVFWIGSGMVFAAAIALGLLQPARLNPDQVIRGTLLYGLLWVAIAGAYVLAGSLVGAAAGTLLPVGWAVAIAMIAAVAFQPLRRRVEQLADRRVFGARADPSQLVVGLGESLAGTYELDTLLPRIATTLEEGMGLTWARVRLEPGPTVDDAPGDPELVVPIEVDGERVGRIECGPKATGQLSAEDAAIIGTFAGQAGLAVRNVRLTQRLAQQAEELNASRARLVRAQEQERRRIERNIHDGVQQELTALIGLAGHARQEYVREGDVDHDLVAMREGLERVLADVRALAQGIHPSVLSDRGLLAAVEALASRHPVPVGVRADPMLRQRRLGDDIEGAGYFAVAEALANSLKHADAHRIDVALSLGDDALRIRVHDDGAGFDPDSATGNGLANLAARVAAVGGTLEVRSTPGEGAAVVAEFALPGDGAAT
ncbi:sensor histidine kinase [Agromyces sp. SYSU T00194]|uniref:sensor histidine kinase n=1 Tax=Agromyces chitinivorans TaxID=3158560 RepID=UPI00339A63E9